MRWYRALVVCGFAGFGVPLHDLAAQPHHDIPLGRRGTAFRVTVGNMLVGGVTAAARASLKKRNPIRAFAVGAVGGAVHVAGKALSAEQGTTYGLAGLALGALGTSIVVNGGRGKAPLSELYLPVGPLRLRLSTGTAPSRLRVGVDAYEAFIAARQFTREGVAIDWSRTTASGALVFVTRNRYITVDKGDTVGGIAIGSSIVLDGYQRDPESIMAHEIVHTHQHWFGQEAIARPLETYLRQRLPGARLLPSWLELGVLPPLAWMVERSIHSGRSAPISRLVESEAYWFTRR
jgi:hypothetical protein